MVDYLERDGQGLDLTWEVRNGIVTHTSGAWARTPEGCVVRRADHIAFLNHDIEDAITAGVLDARQLPPEAVAVLGHTPYLDSFNEENGTHLVSVGAVHYEPFGIYPGKSDDLANIADGATIAVPNDTTNEARALQLLAAQGLITVRDGAGLTATVNDITDNPHNLQIKEIEAAQLPRTVQDVDFAVINGNYAMEAGFSVGKDALATEDASSEAAQTYANVLVVKEGRENDPAIQALYAALTSDKVKDYINSTYDGAVVPIF